MKFFKVVLVLSCLMMIGQNSYACSCMEQKSVKEEIPASALVAVAKVVSVKIHNALHSGEYLKARMAHYKVVIEKIYKGQVTSDTLTIITGVDGADCGFNFTVGQKFIIYGHMASEVINGQRVFPQNTFTTNICTRTRAFDKEEIVEIEKNLKPVSR